MHIMRMFRQSTNQNHYPVFGEAVASLDGINGWSIQTLLRGENDSKQSGEIQATFTDCFNCLHTERSP